MATNVQKLTPKSAAGAVPGDNAGQKAKRKLVQIFILAVVMLALGSGGAWYLLSGAVPGSAEQVAPPPEPPVFVTLDTFTVNLQPEDNDHYLQTGITLQVTDKAEVDRIKLYTPVVRSRLLVLLSSKKASDLTTTEGKNQLVNEIIEQIRQPFTTNGPEQKISSVFFTSFVIQ